MSNGEPLLTTDNVQSDCTSAQDIDADRVHEIKIGELGHGATSTASCYDLLFIITTLLSALCIGFWYGWGPLAKILEMEGVASQSCWQNRAPCSAQDIFFSMLFTVGLSFAAFGGLPAGVLIDKAGPTITAIVAGFLTGTGLLLLAALPSTQDFTYFYFAPLVLIGSGSICTLLTCFKSAAVFPQHSSLIMTAVNVLYDISAIEPLLASELYRRVGYSRGTIFGSWSVYVYVLYALWALLWRRQKGKLIAQAQNASELEMTTISAAGNTPPPPMPLLPCKTIPSVNLPDASLCDMLCTKQFIAGTVWFNLQQFRCMWYLSSSKSMLLQYGDKDGNYMEIFTAMLMGAVPAIPLISYVVDRLDIAASMQAVTVLAALHSICSLIPSLEFQVVTFAIFAILRPATFSVASMFVAKVFGFAKLGTIYGLMICCAQVINFCLPALTAAALGGFNGDWSPIIWGMLLTCVFQFGLIWWLVHTLQVDETNGTDCLRSQAGD